MGLNKNYVTNTFGKHIFEFLFTSMPILLDTKSISLATTFDSNAENAAVHRILKQADLCHGDAFTSTMCCMMMCCLYFLAHTFLVTDNTVTVVLGFWDELLLRTEAEFLSKNFMASAVD